jgi:hypothetical protein
MFYLKDNWLGLRLWCSNATFNNISVISNQGSSWSYGSWIYNYLCNQCLSPLTLWVRVPLMARRIRNNLMENSDSTPPCIWASTNQGSIFPTFFVHVISVFRKFEIRQSCSCCGDWLYWSRNWLPFRIPGKLSSMAKWTWTKGQTTIYKTYT